MRTLAIVIALLAGILAVRRCDHEPAERWRCATFNIEDFPKNQRQIDGAFDEILRLDASIIAVQEIMDTSVFSAAVTTRLGLDWEVVYLHERTPARQLGVLFDRRAYALITTRAHDGTSLGGRQKATFEVVLRDRVHGETLHVLVIHFKAGGENHPVRRRQYAAITKIVDEVRASGDPVILLGDFNATGQADRVDLDRLARATELTWASEPLACTAFWDRDDGCPRSRLDHILTTRRPAQVHAAGACATEGCEWQASCPLYNEYISDHCPVVATFER